MKHIGIIFILSALLLAGCTGKTAVTSPDGRTNIRFSLTESGEPQYSVTKDGKAVIDPSRLGMVFEGNEFTSGLKIKSVERDSKDEIWQQVWGEESFARNHYREMAVTLTNSEEQQLIIRFRAFNDGVAFRYETCPLQGKDNVSQEFVLTDELTEYRFVSNPETWSLPWDTPFYEGLWEKSLLSRKKDTLCSPLTLEFEDGTYGFLHEANLTDYAAQNFYIKQDATLGTYLTPWSNGVKVYGEYGKTVSPWRFLILADNITELAASRIMLNLNEPCKIEDTSWIKPMKFIGIWWAIHLDHYTWCYRLLDEKGRFIALSPNHGATTENMCRYIDFAAEHGFGGVLAEGWNEGWDGDWTSNLAEFSKPTPDFDMEYLSKYAQEKGVQIIGHHETGGNVTHYEEQMEDAFHYYDVHGIHNVKTGYVHSKLEGKEWHKSQYGVRHMRKVIETAAREHVCIDNHECVMPTGLQRTYPNLMSGEGVRGQEWDAWSTDGGSPAQHLCVLPFTRVMAGPVDFTPGTFDFSNPIHPQTRVHSTLARQLALFVVIYSPLQMASDLPESYMQHPEAFRFIEDVPCDWQRSVVLDAKIGEYVLTARQDKNSSDWYVGAITNEEEREVNIDLSFLDKGKTYTAEIYRDTENTEWQNNPYDIAIETRQVRAGDVLRLTLNAAGGAAVRLTE